MILKKLKQWWLSRQLYVIADPADNSITLSAGLYVHIRDNAPRYYAPPVFVFKIPHHNAFGFMVDPGIGDNTQLCQIQYNAKFRCVGFETLCPSVGRILYDYGLLATRPIRLRVSVCRTPQGKIYYRFNPPSLRTGRHAKHSQ